MRLHQYAAYVKSAKREGEKEREKQPKEIDEYVESVLNLSRREEQQLQIIDKCQEIN